MSHRHLFLQVIFTRNAFKSFSSPWPNKIVVGSIKSNNACLIETKLCLTPAKVVIPLYRVLRSITICEGSTNSSSIFSWFTLITVNRINSIPSVVYPISQSKAKMVSGGEEEDDGGTLINGRPACSLSTCSSNQTTPSVTTPFSIFLFATIYLWIHGVLFHTQGIPECHHNMCRSAVFHQSSVRPATVQNDTGTPWRLLHPESPWP